MNNTDLVTRLPPPKGYQHIGRKVYFTRKGKATNQLNKFQRFLDGLNAAVGDLGKLGPKNIKDHDMNMYVRRTRKNIGIELAWQQRRFTSRICCPTFLSLSPTTRGAIASW